MCGISAVINGKLCDLDKMNTVIKNRGIKDSFHAVGNLKVIFTHLPITNENYSQPCTYVGITLWLNGFISNWKELAKEENLIAESDTELLTWWISHDRPLDRLNGFFAVLYHSKEGVKYFTDRYGIKQLYIYEKDGTTYICSEVKGIKALFNLETDSYAVEDWYYSLGVMTENTIYKGITRAPKLPFKIPEKIDIPYEQAKDILTMLWMRSVRRNKYNNDGVYLSGGVDSGMIAKWFKPEYSFSVDYLDERSEIQNIKRNTVGKHHVLICNNSMRDYAKRTFKAIDDLKVGSCYTNFALAELASKFVKVVYSGAGGDEVFNGYTHRYSKPINEVIKRTSHKGKQYDITHKEYDWKYLQGILIIEDRIGGYHTMETRYPFLDNDLVDFALSLPDEYLYNKRILKDISALPKEITEGKKMGFTNPHFTNDQWVEQSILWTFTQKTT